MSGKTFENDRVYHSTLKFKSPLKVQFTSDVQQSQFSDDFIRFFIVAGDDYDGYYYQIENEEIREKLEKVPNNQWVKLTAAGDGRDDSATLDIQAADGPEVSSNRGGQGSTPSSNSNGSEPRLGPENILDQYDLVLEKAKERFPEVMLNEDGDLTEVGARLATTLYIQWSRTGRKAPLFEGQGEDMAEPFHADSIEEHLESLDWSGNSHDGRPMDQMKNRFEGLVEKIREGDALASAAEDAIEWLNREFDDQSERVEDSGSIGDDDLPF